MIAAGATTIHEVQFESNTLQTARRHALAQALANAHQDAAALAQGAGGRLGRLLRMTTSPDAGTVPEVDLSERGYAASASAPARWRDVVVSVTVEARWEFLAAH